MMRRVCAVAGLRTRCQQLRRLTGARALQQSDSTSSSSSSSSSIPSVLAYADGASAGIRVAAVAGAAGGPVDGPRAGHRRQVRG